MRRCEDVDETLPFDRDGFARPRNWPAALRWLADLRRRHFDLVIDYQGLLRSGVFTGLVRAPRKVGFAHAREGAPLAYRQKVAVPAACTHAVDRYIFLTNAALGTDEPCPMPRLSRPAADIAAADELLAAAGLTAAAPLVAVAPVTRWPSKTWPPDFLADALRLALPALPDTAAVLLVGTAEDSPAAAAVAAAARTDRVHNLAGRTSLGVMMELLRRSAVLLCGDSGPMHLAAALGVPTVALFGPTDPRLTAPYGPRHRVIATKVSCAPCFNRVCPLPRQLCRDDVASPELVAAAVVELAGGSTPG